MGKTNRKAPRLLTPGEASDRLGCTPNTLALWCEGGGGKAPIPALRGAVVRSPGGHRRYREDVIDAYRDRKAS